MVASLPDDWRTPRPRDEGLPIIGRSPAMQEVYRIMARLMNTDLTVMIKDNNLIEDYAKENNAPVPVFQASMFSAYAALAQGYGQEDPGVVTRVYEEMAGIPRKKRAKRK